MKDMEKFDSNGFNFKYNRLYFTIVALLFIEFGIITFFQTIDKSSSLDAICINLTQKTELSIISVNNFSQNVTL